MSTQPSSSSQPDPSPVAALLSPSVPPPITPAAETVLAGGARKLSRWEELEEVWFPEPTDYSHSGINE